MTPQQRGGINAPLMRETNLNIDAALASALGNEPDARAAAIFVPTQQTQAWRVQLRTENSECLTAVMVDDRNGAASKVVRLQGDRIAQWIRWIHEGSHSGVLWQVVVFVCGLLPTLFAITGLLIWLRRRRLKAPQLEGRAVPQVEAAE